MLTERALRWEDGGSSRSNMGSGLQREAGQREAMANESYDVVIVGAGTGGLNVGSLLATGGKRVLVLEQQSEVTPAKADISSEELKLDVILDVPVTMSMEIGRTKINIRNLLQLNQGSVIELDRFAGEPMDVFVNGTLIAHGEVVVVNDKFGIRLTDVISPSERVKKLG